MSPSDGTGQMSCGYELIINLAVIHRNEETYVLRARRLLIINSPSFLEASTAGPLRLHYTLAGFAAFFPLLFERCATEAPRVGEKVRQDVIV